MATRKRDTSKKRDSILDAAQEAFTNEGYDKASMDRIALLAGASKRTVYNHFASKEELFQAVLDRFMGEIVALKQIRYDARRSLVAQLADFANAKMAILKNPAWLGLMKVTIGVFISNPDLAQRTMLRADDEADTLEAWLCAAHENGRLKVPDPKLAAQAFWAGVGGGLFFPALFKGPLNVREANALRDELIEMFLARYKA